MGYAFISYSSKNLEDALAMRGALTNRGVETWMAPGDIPAGSNYAGVITRAIKGAKCLVLLLTDDSQNSKWVDKEVERALSYGKTVIPVAPGSIVLNDNFEFYLGNQQIVPVKQISDSNDEFLRIIEHVIKLTGSSVGEAGSVLTGAPSGEAGSVLTCAPSDEAGSAKDAGATYSRGLGLTKCLTSYIPVGPEVGLIGRDIILDQIRDLLDSKNSVALVSDIDGIGKTAVMAQICNSIISEGRKDTYVAWITCGDSHIDDLLNLRQMLGVPEGLGREEAYNAVVWKLQDLQGTLYLFLDDMARMPVGIYNAFSPNVRVMITTRHDIKGIPQVDVKKLGKDPAVEMFYAFYGMDIERKYVADALAIIDSGSVRRHTLLVELLAKAAKAFVGSLAEFRKKLEEEGFLKVSRRRFDAGRFDNTTIKESVTQLYEISNLTTEQQRIMQLFSIFTPEKVIYGAVEEWAGLDSDAVDDLIRLGWIVTAEDGFIIHQIIRDSLKQQIGGSLQIEKYGELLDRVIDTENYIPQDLDYTAVQERVVMAEDIARYLTDRTIGWMDSGNITEEKKKLLTYTSDLYHNIANVFRMQGDYEKALEYYWKTLSIKEIMLGFEHPSMATTYDNMADVFYAQRLYGRALEYYGKALAIKENVLGLEHLDTATSYSNIAGVDFALGNCKEALEYYGKALAIKENVLGLEHPDTAMSYSNIAGVDCALCDYESALEYYGRSLSICERMLGPGHPDTAKAYANMADVYHKQHDDWKALEYYGKALSIRERMLGPGHPDTVTTYISMARVFKHDRIYERALEYYGKALSIREQVLGPGHPDTARAYAYMAEVYHEQHDYEKAQKYYGKALTISERVLGFEHPFTKSMYHSVQSLPKWKFTKSEKQ